MPQFSIYKNKHPKSRNTYPYLVDVQSSLLSDLGTRVVVPLLKRSAASDRKPVKNLMPAVRVDGQEFIMMTQQLAGIAVGSLGTPVASASEYRDEIVKALDFLITGI